MSDNDSVMERFEEWAHLRHRNAADAAPQTPAQQPAKMAVATAAAATQQEESMPFLDDLEGFITDVKEIGPQAIADVKAVGAAAVADLKAVKANPETADVLGDLAKLASLAPQVGIPADAIAGVARGLKVLVSLYDTVAAAPADQPAAPVQDAGQVGQPVPATQ